MRRISDTVWLALSGDHDDVAGDTHDGNGYLIWDGHDGVLVDAGTGLDARAWLRNVAAIVPLERLAGLLLTHYHADHAGGASAAVDAGLRVYGSLETAAALATADESRTQLATARSAGYYPHDYRLPRCQEVRTVRQEERIGPLRISEAPGHCDGHVVGLMDDGPNRTSLFSGDVLFPGGEVSILAIPDCRLDVYARTMRLIAAEPLTALYPGHGPEELDPRRAKASAISAAGTFARLIPPPNHLS